MNIKTVVQWLGDDTVVFHWPRQHHDRGRCQIKDHSEGDLSGMRILGQECVGFKSHGSEASHGLENK